MNETNIGQQHVWHADSYSSSFSAQFGNYNLVVLMPEPGDRLVRFLVLRQDGDDGAEALIGSGTTEELLAAMTAAARMAARLAGKQGAVPSGPDRQQPAPEEWDRTGKPLWRAVRTSVRRA